MIFLPFFILFLVILTYNIKKNSHAEQEVTENFWRKEQEANLVRKQDISNLNYLLFPFEQFPTDTYGDEQLGVLYHQLQECSQKKMLNLNGISNTDLKLQYGVANLEILSEYDDNYTTCICLLQEYAEQLSQYNPSAAILVLESAVQMESDISNTFLLLAQLYNQEGEIGKMKELYEKAATLSDERSHLIQTKLASLYPSVLL